MMKAELWSRVNRELVAKAIGELTFEQVITPVQKNAHWELTLSCGTTYTFEAWRSVWDHLRVDPLSILREGEADITSAQFFLDSQAETGMDDIILANFLEEMHNTLFSDAEILKAKISHTAEELIQWDGEKLQSILNGHPKILLNKGRIGWGQDALNSFAPEAGLSFQLHWLAVSRELLTGTLPSQELLDESFDQAAKEKFLTHALALGLELNQHCLIPVHPWQWDRFISLQFAGLIGQKKIIYLGAGGDEYRPQISLRTLSNVKRPKLVDIKLPLSILNTSCVRGLPAKSIAIGSQVSSILEQICQDDHLLTTAGTKVLRELAGVSVLHGDFQKIKDAPYRYHEYLGAVWRESARSKIAEAEKAIITASLFHQDESNHSLIGAYIKQSGLSTLQWLKEYFRVVVIPLYHLQLEYGVGMVAHGQNIILVLKDFIPTGMILKDFQGDLRLSSEQPEKGKAYFKDVEAQMTKLPPQYLIHDLITGHFITVLRFISEVLKESDAFPEEDFYQILGQELSAYLKDKNVPDSQNLLKASFQRVLLNKVRFSIGYADSSLRPLPLLGGELLNPMAPSGAR